MKKIQTLTIPAMMTTYDHTKKKKKKTQDYQRRNLVSLLISILITLVCWYGNFISKGRNRANNCHFYFCLHSLLKLYSLSNLWSDHREYG